MALSYAYVVYIVLYMITFVSAIIILYVAVLKREQELPTAKRETWGGPLFYHSPLFYIKIILNNVLNNV